MIRIIQARQYRCLRYVRQELNQFQILVGPNASGKSTFLDVLRLLRDLLLHGPKDAVGLRSPNVENLVWMGQGSRFELAVELEIPPVRRLHPVVGAEGILPTHMDDAAARRAGGARTSLGRVPAASPSPGEQAEGAQVRPGAQVAPSDRPRWDVTSVTHLRPLRAVGRSVPRPDGGPGCPRSPLH